MAIKKRILKRPTIHHEIGAPKRSRRRDERAEAMAAAERYATDAGYAMAFEAALKSHRRSL